MGVESDWEILDTSYGPMRMYTARPEGGTAGPGVLVVCERVGITEHIEGVCRRFADEGIVALAPDLYHRFSPRALGYDDLAGAAARRSQLSDQEVVDDLTIALRFLGARGEVRSGLTGVVGFGEGARDAFLLGTQNPDVLALVCFYGRMVSDQSGSVLEGAASLQAPLLLFYGEADLQNPPDERVRLQATLDGAGVDYDVVTYPDAAYGFFCDARPDAYDPKAAEDAWMRTVDFVYERLEG
jgi:carboxymethylenebutenolidase